MVASNPPSSLPEVRSDGLLLESYLARPASLNPTFPGLVLAHGFPSGVAHSSSTAASFPQLADRIAAEMGWVVLTVSFRGAGRSEGDFSLAGWLTDLEAAVAELSKADRVRGIWLAGFGTGGALSICAGAHLPEIEGVITMGAPADFDDWASDPRQLLTHSREMGLITDPAFPRQLDVWSRELRDIRPSRAVADLAPRPLMIVHGSEDTAVPHLDARALSDAHGSADLRIIGGAGHQLRYDPRAVAVLLGWLDRQNNRVISG